MGDGRVFWRYPFGGLLLGPGLSNNGKLPELTLGPQQLSDAWESLASEETPNGHLAMWQCIASAKQAIPHMMQPGRVYLLDPGCVKKLFRDLDSIHFPTRLAAMRELEGKGRWMEGRYDAAMENPPSLEYKRRVEILKEKLNAKDAKSLAQERLAAPLHADVRAGSSADAIDALQKIADQGPEEELRGRGAGVVATAQEITPRSQAEPRNEGFEKLPCHRHLAPPVAALQPEHGRRQSPAEDLNIQPGRRWRRRLP